jgi:CDP-paratose 2-epimerase
LSLVVITGSAGLVGSEAARHFGGLGLDVVGIDNDMRRVFFGEAASTAWNVGRLRGSLGKSYSHYDTDVRDREALGRIFGRYGRAIRCVVHAAAQPSHDWAARQPLTDFDINAVGTLNLLDATRRYAPDAVFIFTSTNKVYGDAPNRLPFVELETRFEIAGHHPYVNGISEEMSIDESLHSLFGASKVAADVLVQEYGRYFGMRTACFRCGTLTGPQHAAAELHGFLAYVMQCTLSDTPYNVYGYLGKQVRDVIHSKDLVRAFQAFFDSPRTAEVYIMGGGRGSNCSVLEAIDLSQRIAGKPLRWSYVEQNRRGDHIWWIGDLSKFQAHYPGWRLEYDVPRILTEMAGANRDRWKPCATKASVISSAF